VHENLLEQVAYQGANPVADGNDVAEAVAVAAAEAFDRDGYAADRASVAATPRA
jgi:hypothetical protein